MDRFFSVFLLSILLLNSTAGSALCADPVRVVQDEIRVIMIEDSFVYIRAGKDHGVRVGDLFSVTRPGKAIVDPETGDTLGAEPVSIAKLRVAYAAAHYSRTAPLEVVAGIPIQVGDRVVSWTGERTGRVQAPAVMDLVVEEAAPKVRDGDKIFVDKKKRTGDVTGDFEVMGEIIDYDFADLDGDAVPEFVGLEPRKIGVYRVFEGKFEQIWSETIKGFRYITLELHDVDGDGRAEIFAGQKQGNIAKTFVYTFKGAGVAKAGELKDFFVREAGGVLYAQKYGFGKPFAGPVVEIKYDPAAGRATRIRDVYDGSSANCLGMGIGADRMAYLDYNDRLVVTDRSGQPVWRGTNALGGSTQELESGNGKEKIKLQKKIIFEDFNDDGTQDLLVVKNELDPFWGGKVLVGGLKYKNGKFLIYTDRPGGFDVWKETRDFEGYISDYEFTPVGSREKQLSLCVVTSIGREKFKSRIIVLREL